MIAAKRAQRKKMAKIRNIGIKYQTELWVEQKIFNAFSSLLMKYKY